MGIFEATIIEPLFQLINHIYIWDKILEIQQITALFSSLYGLFNIWHLFLHLFLIFGVDLSISS